jgi:hypothetical protein
MNVSDLKKEYEKYEKKFKLPTFKSINEDFEVDKIEYIGDCFLRQIRKSMIEKVVNSVNFLEMLLNPVNAPRIYYGYLKSISVEDKQYIEDLYTNLGQLSVDSLSLEIDYSDAKEAALIKNLFKVWNDLKPKFRQIITHIKNPEKMEAKKEKSYFG